MYVDLGTGLDKAVQRTFWGQLGQFKYRLYQDCIRNENF